jgi:hypothetical protein
MTEPKDFIAVAGSDARKMPRRVMFVTRRTSAQVKSVDEDQVQTYPEALFRAVLAIELLAIGLVLISLFFDAPLEGLADPTNTPNPAKAPWYFLGLQELLHYFPPVVAGVLIPTVFIAALIVIPYFNINVEAEGMFTKDRKRRTRIFLISAAALSVFLAFFDVYVALVPTLLVSGFMLLAALSSAESKSNFRRYLAAKTLSWWIMTWFLINLAVLTAVGTFFRGPGWSWVLPWGN